MWIMTKHGFFSAVQKTTDGPSTLTVRARCKADIEHLAEALGGHRPPERWGGTDYPWRLRCTVAEWAGFLVEEAVGVDYPNFKNEVFGRSKKHERAYHRVWTALLGIEDRQDRRAFKATPPPGPSLFEDVTCPVCHKPNCVDPECLDELTREGWFGSERKQVAQGKRGSRRGRSRRGARS